MNENTRFWRWWGAGLILFGIAIVLGLQVTSNGVTEGILEHQQAENAARVDALQAAWREGGTRGWAIAAMLADLVFIGIYSFGSWLGGRMFMRSGNTALRLLGAAVSGAAIVFFLTDYTETILQFIQLVRDEGVDWMAATASTVRPVKMTAWLVTFFGLLAALGVRRFVANSAR